MLFYMSFFLDDIKNKLSINGASDIKKERAKGRETERERTKNNLYFKRLK